MKHEKKAAGRKPKVEPSQTETKIILLKRSEDFVWFSEASASPPSVPSTPQSAKLLRSPRSV